MDRREEILIAAQHSFLRYGISKLTLADIAHECGIRKTALYYYFKSKEDLLSEMICRKIDEYETMIRASISNSEGVQEKLRIYMKTKIEFMEENTDRSRRDKSSCIIGHV